LFFKGVIRGIYPLYSSSPLIEAFRGDEKDREERERRIKAAPKVAQIKKPRSPGAFLN